MDIFKKLILLSIFLLLIPFVNAGNVPAGDYCKSNSDCLIYPNHQVDGCYWASKTCQDCGRGACISPDNLCFINKEAYYENRYKIMYCCNGTLKTSPCPQITRVPCTTISGTCKDNTGSYTDYCDGNYLTKYSCRFGAGCLSTTVNCGSNYKCVNGVCVLIICRKLNQACRPFSNECCPGLMCRLSGDFGICKPGPRLGIIEGLDSPFVLVAGMIAILIIFVAIFGSIKLMNKR